ncbi:hypothetical protein Agub_g5446, partial [Astrephomene gubernaculifera]
VKAGADAVKAALAASPPAVLEAALRSLVLQASKQQQQQLASPHGAFASSASAAAAAGRVSDQEAHAPAYPYRENSGLVAAPSAAVVAPPAEVEPSTAPAATAAASAAGPLMTSSSLRAAATLSAALTTWEALLVGGQQQQGQHPLATPPPPPDGDGELLAGLVSLVGACRRRLLPPERAPAPAVVEEDATAPVESPAAAVAVASSLQEAPWQWAPRLSQHGAAMEAVWAALGPATQLLLLEGRVAEAGSVDSDGKRMLQQHCQQQQGQLLLSELCRLASASLFGGIGAGGSGSGAVSSSGSSSALHRDGGHVAPPAAAVEEKEGSDAVPNGQVQVGADPTEAASHSGPNSTSNTLASSSTPSSSNNSISSTSTSSGAPNAPSEPDKLLALLRAHQVLRRRLGAGEFEGAGDVIVRQQRELRQQQQQEQRQGQGYREIKEVQVQDMMGTAGKGGGVVDINGHRYDSSSSSGWLGSKASIIHPNIGTRSSMGSSQIAASGMAPPAATTAATTTTTTTSSSNEGTGGCWELLALDRVVLSSTQTFLRSWLRGQPGATEAAAAAADAPHPASLDKDAAGSDSSSGPSSSSSSSSSSPAALSLSDSVQLTVGLARNGCRDWHLLWRLLRHQAAEAEVATSTSARGVRLAVAAAAFSEPQGDSSLAAEARAAAEMAAAAQESSSSSPPEATLASAAPGAAPAAAAAAQGGMRRRRLRLHAAAAVAAALQHSSPEELRGTCWPRTAVKLAAALADVSSHQRIQPLSPPLTQHTPLEDAHTNNSARGMSYQEASTAVAAAAERLLLLHDVDCLPADVEYVATWVRSAAALAEVASPVDDAATQATTARPSGHRISSPRDTDVDAGDAGGGVTLGTGTEQLAASARQLLLRAATQLRSPPQPPSSQPPPPSSDIRSNRRQRGSREGAASPPTSSDVGAASSLPSRPLASSSSSSAAAAAAAHLELLATCAAAPAGWVPPEVVDGCLAAFVDGAATAAAAVSRSPPPPRTFCHPAASVVGGSSSSSSSGSTQERCNSGVGLQAVGVLRALATLRYIPDARLLLPVLEAVTEAAGATRQGPAAALTTRPWRLAAGEAGGSFPAAPREQQQQPLQQQQQPTALPLGSLVAATTAAAELAEAAAEVAEAAAEVAEAGWDAAAVLLAAAVQLRDLTEGALLAAAAEVKQPQEMGSAPPSLPDLAALCASLAPLELLYPRLITAAVRHSLTRMRPPYALPYTSPQAAAQPSDSPCLPQPPHHQPHQHLQPPLPHLHSSNSNSPLTATSSSTSAASPADAAAACQLLHLAAQSQLAPAAAGTAAAVARARRVAFLVRHASGSGEVNLNQNPGGETVHAAAAAAAAAPAAAALHAAWSSAAAGGCDRVTNKEGGEGAAQQQHQQQQEQEGEQQ